MSRSKDRSEPRGAAEPRRCGRHEPRRASGLTLIDAFGGSGALDQYHLFHAARADLLRRLGWRPAAAEAYRRALALTGNAVERAYLERRLAAL